jgi:hypothetical protein
MTVLRSHWAKRCELGLIVLEYRDHSRRRVDQKIREARSSLNNSRSVACTEISRRADGPG